MKRLLLYLVMTLMITTSLSSCAVVLIPRRYPSAYSLNGVHHVRKIEKQMFRGTYFEAHGNRGVLFGVTNRNGYLVPDFRDTLSDDVSIDPEENYVVRIPGYPTVIVPPLSVGMIVVPVHVFTTNAVNTPVYLYSTTHRDTRLAEFMLPACSGRMVLLPAGDENGFDIRWWKSGGANPATFIPDPGHGYTIALNGFPVVLEVKCATIVAQCKVYRPMW